MRIRLILALTLLITVLIMGLGACQDVEGNSVWHWVTPEAQPTMEVVIVPDIDPAEEQGEEEPVPPIAPPCEEIKGNIARDGRKLYHAQDSPNYGQVKIDEDAGEKWFCTVEEAEDAGWVKAGG